MSSDRISSMRARTAFFSLASPRDQRASRSLNSVHSSGTALSWKIALTGHSGSQAPHSMHSSGWIYSLRIEIVGLEVDARDRTDVDTGLVLGVDARLCDGVGHERLVLAPVRYLAIINPQRLRLVCDEHDTVTMLSTR